MLNKSRYLDVMTVSASKGSTLNKDDHKSLFVEPICLPNMSHLKVDKPTEAGDTCLFYPSGRRSVQMKSEIDHAVRRITSEIAIIEHMTFTKPVKSASKKKRPDMQAWMQYDERTLGNFASQSLQAEGESPQSKGVNGSPFGIQSTEMYPTIPTSPEKNGRVTASLYRGLPMDKKSKQLFKKIRENESKIVSTVKPRF